MATRGIRRLRGRADLVPGLRRAGQPRPDGPAPLVVLHGGPGATHDYLLAARRPGPATGPRRSCSTTSSATATPPTTRDRGADFWTVDLFVRELANLIDHLGIGDRYHVLGQSWGGFLAQEHALTQPAGLRSLVLSNTAASFPDFVTEANPLRADLPPDVEATLRRHEADGTTDTAGVRQGLPWSSTSGTSAASTRGRPASPPASPRSTRTRRSTTR